MITKEERDLLQKEIKFYEGFPEKISNDEVTDCQFIREVQEFDFYNNDVDIFMCRDFLLAPQKSDTDVLPLSLNLYGYYTEKHISIRTFDKQKEYFPLYVNTNAFSNYQLSDIELLNEKGKKINCEVILKFSHKPVYNIGYPENDNFWHFELTEQFRFSQNDSYQDVNVLSHSKKKTIGRAMISYILEDENVICSVDKIQPYKNELISNILQKNGIIFN